MKNGINRMLKQAAVFVLIASLLAPNVVFAADLELPWEESYETTAYYDETQPSFTAVNEPDLEWEWVQIHAAGAFDYERDYVKRDLRNNEAVWQRVSNPANAFGPSNPTNNTSLGGREVTGTGSFVDGISYRFGHGADNYRRIYRQPNRDQPDFTITEVAGDIRYHFRGARLYLVNVEFTDGAIAERYYIGDIFNMVYRDRDIHNTVGGYASGNFRIEPLFDNGFFHKFIWFPENVVSAEGVRIVNFTDAIHNWSTARNGDPDTNTGPNPRRTYTRYCYGYAVCSMSAWYRRPVDPMQVEPSRVEFHAGEHGRFECGNGVITIEVRFGQTVQVPEVFIYPATQSNDIQLTGWFQRGSATLLSAEQIEMFRITEDMTFTAQYRNLTEPEWEWVQIWAAGAFDYQRDYVKRDMRNADEVWQRLSNPASAFGPSNPTNNTHLGDGQLTGTGLFVDGISYRFGHGAGNYRRIYRQPNRELPDFTITEVTWDIRWHFRGARLYLVNAEFTDGTSAERYYVGDVFNMVYRDRDVNNTVGGYASGGFRIESSFNNNFFRKSIWFPQNVISAEGVRLVDFTGEIHNWSTARNGDPDANTGPNPRRTYTRYCSGYSVCSMSAWYRRPVDNGYHGDFDKVITTVDQLLYVTTAIQNNGTINGVPAVSARYRLAADLDLSNIDTFFGLGTHDNPFAGTFHGGGYSIRLDINRDLPEFSCCCDYYLYDFDSFSDGIMSAMAEERYIMLAPMWLETYRGHTSGFVGLFRFTDGATISNVTVEGSVTGRINVGGIVGHAINTTISNVENRASITGRHWDDDLSPNIGGIAGYAATSTIINAVNRANVDATISGYGVGGIVGWADRVEITESSSIGDISGSRLVGGLVGRAFDTYISASSVSGNISGWRYDIGGIAGSAWQGTTITNVEVKPGSTIIGEAWWDGWGGLGGIVGHMRGSSVTHSRMHGNVTATPQPDWFLTAGGIAGTAENATITDNEVWGIVYGEIMDDIVGRATNSYVARNTVHRSNYDKIITTADQLLYVTYTIANNGTINGVPAASARYRLAADLDLSNVDTFFGLGTFDNPFAGTFYGGGYSIRLNINYDLEEWCSCGEWWCPGEGWGDCNFWWCECDDGFFAAVALAEERGMEINPMFMPLFSYDNDTDGFVGLFRFTDGATISNVVTEGSVRGRQSVGGIVGSAENTTISNAENRAKITSLHYVDAISPAIGGIAGSIGNSTIINSRNRADITSYFGHGVGGITGGAFNSEIIDSSSVGNIIGVMDVGGIAGRISSWNFNSTISGSTVSGTITSIRFAGGIVGWASSNSIITDVEVTPGTLITGRGWEVGGIVGRLQASSVTYSRMHGDVTANPIQGWPPRFTGGIAGWATNATITDNEIWGIVQGYDDFGDVVGGSANSYIARNMVFSHPVSDNTGLLLWPSHSMEITLWYGQLDHLSNVESPGLNIQGTTGSNVYAVADAIVAYVSPYAVHLNFKLDGVTMQAVYGNIVPDRMLRVGHRVSQGRVIGQMSEHMNRGVLEIELRRPENGQLVQVGGGNSVTTNPAPFFDLSGMASGFLHNPMSNFFERNANEQQGALGRSGGGATYADIAYALNLDLEEGQVYLRKHIEALYYSQGGADSSQIIHWDEYTQTVMVYMFGNWYMFVPQDMYDMMAKERLLGRTVGFSSRSPYEDFDLFPYDGIVNDRIVIRPRRGTTRETAIEISMVQHRSGSTDNYTGERWYKVRGDFFGGIIIGTSITDPNYPLRVEIFADNNTRPVHSHTMPNATSWQRNVREYGARNPIVRHEWYYIRISAVRSGHRNDYSFMMWYTLQRPNPTFSAFAIGTNLFNLDEGRIPHPATGDPTGSISNFEDISNQHSILNPAELFASHMNRNMWIENDVMINRHGVGNNASLDEIVASIRGSDLAFIAGHGDSRFLIKQDIIIDSAGLPTLKDNGAELVDHREWSFITPQNLDLAGSQTAWLVFSACAQLNNQEGRYESQHWADALIRNGSVHGILGYWGLGPGGMGQLNAIDRFFDEIYGRTLLHSWRVANSPFRGWSRWAVIVNSVNKEDRLFRLTNTDTRPADQRIIYRYWHTENRWGSGNNIVLPPRPRAIQNDFENQTLNPELMSLTATSYNKPFSAIVWQHEVTMYSNRHFQLVTPMFDFAYAGPVNFDMVQAYLIAAELLANLGVLPEHYVISVYSIVREEMGSLASTIETIEYEVVISPSIRGARFFNGNEISVRVTEFGVMDVYYRWLDIEFDTGTIIPFNAVLSVDSFLGADIFLLNGYTINTLEHVYYLDANNTLRIAFKAIDEFGFVVGLVDAITENLVDKFH